MGRVILKPCELHTKKVSNGIVYVYAGLWDITSSDIRTHEIFCDVMYRCQVFSFDNSGKMPNKREPYTFDDGGETISWIENMIKAIRYLKSKNIEVVIELNKKFCLSYGVNENFERDYTDSVSENIINIYFAGLYRLFKQNWVNIVTKCNTLDSYSRFAIYNSNRICIQCGALKFKYKN